MCTVMQTIIASYGIPSWHRHRCVAAPAQHLLYALFRVGGLFVGVSGPFLRRHPVVLRALCPAISCRWSGGLDNVKALQEWILKKVSVLQPAFCWLLDI